MFVDEARVFVSSGKGGDGAVSFHREKYRPRGGPDGGDGGRGGSVIFVADPGVGSLGGLKDHPHQRAASGGKGSKNNRTGADANDLTVTVPLGTVVKDDLSNVLADLTLPGDQVVIAKGGRGGRGNASFKGDQRRLPGFAELGEPGEERWLQLEIRSIADVAVIGFPNAGKSTLVSALSGAKPKIAAYPFTTLEPSLGIVEFEDFRFTICDIPGLIEGAHEGKGLGLKFLRHAERAPIFVHIIDLVSGRDGVADYETVQNELSRFREDLATRPEVVVLNKSDIAEDETASHLQKRFKEKGIDTMTISAEARTGLDGLLERTVSLVKENRAAPSHEGFELFHTPPDRIEVKREDSAWRVEGTAIRRWVAMTDMGNPEAVGYLQNRLERAGVETALAKAGAEKGDEVRIGAIAFEWWPAGSQP